MTSQLDLLTPSTLPCLVGGAARTFSAKYDVMDPHTPGKVLHSASAVSTEAEVNEVIDIAAKAFKVWKATSVLERRRIFIKASTLLRERIAEYAAKEFRETTSSKKWSALEIGMAAEGLEEAAASATSALRGEICVSSPLRYTGSLRRTLTLSDALFADH